MPSQKASRFVFLTIMSAMMRRLLWPLLAIALALIPVAGLFTTTRIFFVRDLAMYFWPHHLWLKATWAAGHWPWWDPFVGAGQSGIADSLNHVFLVPLTAVRLLASDVVGFNLWVAAPLPLAALGGYLLLRVDASRAGALLGASLFALSGPIASSPNFPNLSWTAALMPWVLWRARVAAERPDPLAGAAVAVVFGIQAVCGEPMILGTTAAAAVAMACTFGGARIARRLAVLIGGLAAGGMLAAVQLFPLADAARRSARAAVASDPMWPLHPVNLLETVLPHLFGHYYDTIDPDRWLLALNDQPAPFFFSLYLGAAILLWAVASRGHDARRVRWFWVAAAAVSLVMAFGGHTPVYSFVQTVVPPLRTLRFPIKYFLLTTLALSALASLGWDVLRSRCLRQDRSTPDAVRLALAVAVLALIAAGPALLAPAWTMVPVRAVAALSGVGYETDAATHLVGRVAVLAPRLSVLAAGWALLAWTAYRSPGRAPAALAALFVLTIADVAVTNADLNPTLPAAMLRAPAWVAAMQQHGDGRVYVGGRWGLPSESRKTYTYSAVDGGHEVSLPAEYSAIEARAMRDHELSLSPSAWGVGEVVSFDMPLLISREYVAVLRQFIRRTRDERLRFLERVGVRYCVLPQPPSAGRQPIARLRVLPDMALYDCFPSAARVSVVPGATVIGAPADAIDALFRADFDPSRSVVIESAPGAAAGRPGKPAAAARARIVRDDPDHVTVDAVVGEEGGYLVQFDSYDNGWGVRVDGQPARILRAFGMFRAVRLTPGRHRVDFVYFPRVLAAGAAISGLTAAGLLATVLVTGSRVRRLRRASVRRETARAT